MLRTILIYGALLAAATLTLQWLEFRFLVMSHAMEVYVALVAMIFLGLGIWVGLRLFHRAPPGPFEPNKAAQETLGISARELGMIR